jgi:hypothetical protein
VIEAASTATTEGRRRAMVAASVQQRLVRPAQLRSVVEQWLTLPHRAVILETIDDVEGGAHSLPELEWSRGLRRVGLPEPSRQRIVRRPAVATTWTRSSTRGWSPWRSTGRAT